ncbi:MAG: glycosyltransferase family 2 protein [Candidatus Heimdallarchaeaceae archaeon]
MPYNLLKKIGLTTSFLTFFVSIIIILVYLIIGFIRSVIDWIKLLIEAQNENILNIVAISIAIIFTFGLIIYILGEIIDFLFGSYPSILLEKQEKELSKEEKEKISVIIPAYDEEKTIGKAIDKVKPYCQNVIVVNDGSKDNTKKIAEQKGAIIVDHKLNQGLGQSLRDGIKRALAIGSKVIINFDADLQYRAEEIPMLVYYIFHEDYDLVMGSRFKGEIEEMPLMKKFGNRAYTRLLRYLTKTGISDGQTGFRAFTSNFAKMIKIRGDFTYTQEMILEAITRRAKIGEVPIHFDRRADGKSRLMKNPLHFAKSSGIFLIKVLVDLNPLKIFSLFSGVLIVIGFYLGGSELINWIITGVMENPILIITGIVIIMGAIIILSFAVLTSSTRR